MVSISIRPSRYSYDIIEKTGEFVIKEKLARACDFCGVVSGRDVDKENRLPGQTSRKTMSDRQTMFIAWWLFYYHIANHSMLIHLVETCLKFESK